MKKKLAGMALLCILLLSGSLVSAIEINIPIEDIEDMGDTIDIDEITIDNNQTRTILVTNGPIARRLTGISLTNGSNSQIQQIQRIINRRILQFIRPLAIIPVSDISFSITYRRNIISPRSGFSFQTTTTDYVNGSITNTITVRNERHTVIVEDFTGFFYSLRGRPIRPLKLRPASFGFVGSCESAIIV